MFDGTSVCGLVEEITLQTCAFHFGRKCWRWIINKNHTLWLKYVEVEVETKNKFINHARNFWDRVVMLLLRVYHVRNV